MSDQSSRCFGIARKVVRAICILAVSGLIGALFIRFAPGYGTSEEQLDARLSRRTLEALYRDRPKENLLVFYVAYVGRLMHGDAGQSSVFGQPVATLIGERAGKTVSELIAALALSWIAALAFATAAVVSRRTSVALVSTLATSTLVSVPSAVFATVCLVLYLPPSFAIAAVVFPRIFSHIYSQFRATLVKSHVLMARAKGLSGMRVFLYHIVPAVTAPVLAIAGVSVSLALGASIPVEVLADVPGLGQLAWRAALGRDLPVLVAVTLMLTSATVLANLVFEIIMERVDARVL